MPGAEPLPPLRVRDVGGSPNIIPVFDLIVSNGTLSQMAPGIARLSLAAAGGAAGSQTIGMSNLGNTSGTTGVVSGSAVRFVFAGGNNITLSQSLDAGNVSGTITISGPTGGGIFSSAGMSNIGNTSGTTGLVGSQVVLAGGNNITLSQSVNGASATVTVSAFNQSVESQTLGMSNIGNTSGTTGVASGGQVQFLFAGGNNVTLSQSLNGASGTITISAANETQTVPPIATAVKVAVSTTASTGTITRFSPEDHLHQGVNSIGISNIGNTSGTSSIAPGRMVLAGGNNITLSQATDATGSTMTISGGLTVPTLTFWNNFIGAAVSQTIGALQRSLWVTPLLGSINLFPGNMTVSTLNLMLAATHTNTSATTEAQSSTISIGFYTLNGNTLSLWNSGSTSWGFAAASDMSSNYHGQRVISLNSSLFASSLSFTPGHYWIGFWHNTSGTSFSAFSLWMGGIGANAQRSGTLGASTVTATTMGFMPFAPAVYSATFTTGMPSALNQSDMNFALGGASAFVNASYLNAQFNNVTSKF